MSSDSSDTVNVAGFDLDAWTVRTLSQLCASAMSDDDTFEKLPIPIRAMMAALVLSSTGRRLNKKVLASVGRYSRTTAQRNPGGWGPELDAFVQHASERASKLLERAPAEEDASVLRSELDAANQKLGEARKRVRELEDALEPLASYAHDLTRELRQYREEERASLDANLIPIRGRADLEES